MLFKIDETVTITIDSIEVTPKSFGNLLGNESPVPVSIPAIEAIIDGDDRCR